VLLEHWRAAKDLPVGVTAQDGMRALQPAALWLHQKEERTRAKAAELAPHIEPVLKALDWSGGTAEDFLRTIQDDSGLLTVKLIRRSCRPGHTRRGQSVAGQSLITGGVGIVSRRGSRIDAPQNESMVISFLKIPDNIIRPGGYESR
jgi:hypothetical protein